MIKLPLPEFCYSQNLMKSVDGIVVHFISARRDFPDDPFNLDEIIKIFKIYGVSAHYLIRRDGTQIELVPELHKAYHAKKTIMNNREHCNGFTIGIELEGGTIFPYTDEQILSLGELSAQIMTEHKFTSEWVQGHDEVRQNWNEKYPSKMASIKSDPGKHFPWETYKDMIGGVGFSTKDG